MYHLGVAARVLGHTLKAHRSVTPRSYTAQLSFGMLQLRDTLLYLARHQIHCYRLPHTVLPIPVGGDLEPCRAAIHTTATLCAEVGKFAKDHGIRLSVHARLSLPLTAPDPVVAERAAAELGLWAALFDAMNCGREGVLVVHVGGAHGSEGQALELFARRYERLPEATRRRVVVEADEDVFDVGALVWLRRWCGVSLLFDALHFQLHNPTNLSVAEAVQLAVGSWPEKSRPKIHFSSQRTEAHVHEARRGATAQIVPPRRGQHADYINPFEFAAFIRSVADMPHFDIMLEAKAADLALLRLREDLRDLAPDVAALVW